MLTDSLVKRLAAYPLEWPKHLAWRALTAQWRQRGGLSAAQLDALHSAYPLDCYRPTWPIRVALFLFTLVGVGLGGLFVGVLFRWGVTVGSALVLLGTVAALELSIREKRLYHAGPDNALLYTAVLAALVLIGQLAAWGIDGPGSFNLENLRLLPSLLLLLSVLVAAVARYAERGVTAFAFLVYLLTVTNLLLPWAWGRMLLPFGLMGGAGAVVWRARAPQRATAATYYYEGARQTLRLLGLAVVYLAGNYLVVREVNADLNHLYPSPHPPLGGLFIVLTAVVPLGYIGLALQRQDRLLLTLGLVAVGFSGYTLRFYRSVLPPAIAATLAGLALVALAFVLIRSLRPMRHGLTSLPETPADPTEDAANPFSRVNLQAFAAEQLTPEMPLPDGGPATEFGGGHFGGGGATSNY
jgi:hypothetical protein